jgi:hypothetical protein
VTQSSFSRMKMLRITTQTMSRYALSPVPDHIHLNSTISPAVHFYRCQGGQNLLDDDGFRNSEVKVDWYAELFVVINAIKCTHLLRKGVFPAPEIVHQHFELVMELSHEGWQILTSAELWTINRDNKSVQSLVRRRTDRPFWLKLYTSAWRF